jgi:hypothetical protein
MSDVVGGQKEMSALDRLVLLVGLFSLVCHRPSVVGRRPFVDRLCVHCPSLLLVIGYRWASSGVVGLARVFCLLLLPWWQR